MFDCAKKVRHAVFRRPVSEFRCKFGRCSIGFESLAKFCEGLSALIKNVWVSSHAQLGFKNCDALSRIRSCGRLAVKIGLGHTIIKIFRQRGSFLNFNGLKRVRTVCFSSNSYPFTSCLYLLVEPLKNQKPCLLKILCPLRFSSLEGFLSGVYFQAQRLLLFKLITFFYRVSRALEQLEV